MPSPIRPRELWVGAYDIPSHRHMVCSDTYPQTYIRESDSAHRFAWIHSQIYLQLKTHRNCFARFSKHLRECKEDAENRPVDRVLFLRALRRHAISSCPFCAAQELLCRIAFLCKAGLGRGGCRWCNLHPRNWLRLSLTEAWVEWPWANVPGPRRADAAPSSRR